MTLHITKRYSLAEVRPVSDVNFARAELDCCNDEIRLIEFDWPGRVERQKCDVVLNLKFMVDKNRLALRALKRIMYAKALRVQTSVELCRAWSNLMYIVCPI